MFALILLTAVGAPVDKSPQYPKPPQYQVDELPKASPDPYGFATYSDFYFHVRDKGGVGVLSVGVDDQYVGSYTPHCRIKADGYLGFAAGVYDFHRESSGRVVYTRREAVSQVRATPKALSGASTPHTAAPPVVTSPPVAAGLGSSGVTTRMERTLIPARSAGLLGGTNCPPSG